MQADGDKTRGFEGYQLDLRRGCLRCGDREIALRAKSFGLLRYLMENAGRLVGKDELIKAIWPNVTATDDSLAQCISDIRSALTDGEQRIIKTVVGRGYCFAVPVLVEATGVLPTSSAITYRDHGHTVDRDVAAAAARNGIPASRFSIVVLPFANLGGDPEQEYFVDGVTESLTTDLSRMSGAFVIARSTAFTYKGKAVDVKQIGRELGVRYLLEGSVQRGGDRIRINVQLVDAESGAHLWAERFDRNRVNLFEMQDEIVAHLARTLDAELTAAEARRAERSHSANLDALDLSFRGWAAYNRGHSLGDLLEAARFFDQALMLDHQNVGPLAGLALAKLSPYSGIHTKEERAIHYAAAEAAAAKAVAVAPNNACAHRALGWAYTLTDRAALGIARFERAIALDRNHAPAYGGIGWAKILLGRAEEAEDHIACALRLSPRDRLAYQWYHFVGTANLCLGRYDEAEIWLRRSIEVDMTYPQAQFALAVALAQQGKLASAQAAAKQGLALAPASTVRRFRDGAPSSHPTFLTQRERFYDGLRKAGVPEG